RHQQEEQQVDGLAVDGVEVDWTFQFHQRADGAAALAHAAVRDGDAAPEPSAAQLFARDQRVVDLVRAKVVDLRGDQLGGGFEQPLLADALDVAEGQFRAQYRIDLHTVPYSCS